MPWPNYALDNFMAPKLSQLTTCGANELAARESVLSAFLLNSILIVRLPERLHALAFNLIRRVDQAQYEYVQGRASLIQYIGHKPQQVITPYFRALSHFEQCIAMVAQAAKFAERILPEKLSKQGDQSPLERLKRLYNDSKHMEGTIASGTLPDNATTAVWIVNEGVEGQDASVTFYELCELLLSLHNFTTQLAVELPKLYQARVKESEASHRT